VKFAVWENAVQVFEPRIARGAVRFGGTRAPQGIPFTDFEGVIALQAAPTAFFIPVEGELLGTALTLRFQPARSDFKAPYTQFVGAYAIVGPTTLMIPLYTGFTLPLKPAAFLVERATQGNTLTLDVQVGQNAMRADRSLQYTGGGVGAKGTYNFGVKLCNGSC
jgi:hypothetical protein